MAASYLARARGSGEPELSITRTKDLEQFLRECRAFQMDHAHEYGAPGNRLDERLDDLRRRFEELLGNANGYVVEIERSRVNLSPTNRVLKGEEALARWHHCQPGCVSGMLLYILGASPPSFVGRSFFVFLTANCALESIIPSIKHLLFTVTPHLIDYRFNINFFVTFGHGPFSGDSVCIDLWIHVPAFLSSPQIKATFCKFPTKQWYSLGHVSDEIGDA